MTNEELAKIRKKFKDLQENRTKFLKVSRELELLEENPIVKEYLKLFAFFDDMSGYDFDEKTDDDLLVMALHYVSINETNNIYVCVGTFQNNYEYDIEHGSTDYRVNKDDPDADYRIYRNLEQETDEIKEIIDNCEKFEQGHIVIYPRCPQTNTHLCERYYQKLRTEFLRTSVYESQEKALQKVLNMRNK